VEGAIGAAEALSVVASVEELEVLRTSPLGQVLGHGGRGAGSLFSRSLAHTLSHVFALSLLLVTGAGSLFSRSLAHTLSHVFALSLPL